MINLYAKFGVSVHAKPEQIQRAIKLAAQKQSMSLKEIQKAQQWLLNPDIRKKYNAKLFAEYPELIEQLVEYEMNKKEQHHQPNTTKEKLAVSARHDNKIKKQNRNCPLPCYIICRWLLSRLPLSRFAKFSQCSRRWRCQ